MGLRRVWWRALVLAGERWLFVRLGRLARGAFGAVAAQGGSREQCPRLCTLEQVLA